MHAVNTSGKGLSFRSSIVGSTNANRPTHSSTSVTPICTEKTHDVTLNVAVELNHGYSVYDRRGRSNWCELPQAFHLASTTTRSLLYSFPRRESPALYDRLMHECFRGGLTSPRIIQEGLDEATILSLVATGLGVGWVLGTACPKSVVILSAVELNVPLPLSLAWRRDNTSPLLASFVKRGTAIARRTSSQ